MMDAMDVLMESQEEAGSQELAWAGLFGLAAVLFNERPEGELLEKVLSGQLREAIEAYCDQAGDESPIASGLARMAGWCAAHEGGDRKAASDELGVDRTRLYRGIAPGYGPEAPYESVWTGHASDPTDVLLALVDAYGQAGYELAQEAGERLDYLGVELEFCRRLLLEQAQAAQAGDEAAYGRADEALSVFLAGHVGAWAPRFLDEALAQAKTDFYTGHIVFVKGLLEEACSWRDAPRD